MSGPMTNLFTVSSMDDQARATASTAAHQQAGTAIGIDPHERLRILEHLTDNTGRPILYVDAGHVVRFVNRPFQDWIGKTESAIVGRHASAVFSPEAYAFYAPHLQRALGGETTHVETVSLARAADAHHVRVSFFPDMQNGTGKGIFILALDIEHDHQLRQSLIAKEDNIRTIADNIGMPLTKCDRDLRYLYVNRVACEWLARTEDEIIGRSWAEMIGAEQFAQIEDDAKRALAGESVSCQRYARFPGHPAGHVQVNFFPDRDANGDVCGLFATVTDIDHDYRLKEELFDRERKLRLVTDSIGMPISYISADRRVRFFNRTSAEWSGVAEQAVVGKSVEDAFDSEVLGFVGPFLDKALAGVPATYERLADFPKRGPRWVRGHLVPDLRPDGTVAGVYTVMTDIQNDVLMRENLLQQERQLRLFTDNIPEVIAYLDTSRRYKFVNNRFLQNQGKLRHEVIGRTSAEVLGAEAAHIADEFVARALKGETVTYERLARTSDGEPRWFRIRTVPDKDTAGVVHGLYVVGMDIHEIKLAQATLETSEAELRYAMDALPYPMAYIDRAYRYRLVNRPVETMLGKSREELLSAPVAQLLGADMFSQLKPDWDRALAGETVTVERLVGTEPVAQRWMVVRYTPRRDAAGNVIGLYAASIDVDELKRAELGLRHANWMLSSHFENTPLAVIEWDQDYKVRRWSPQAEKIFGWWQDELIGRHYRDWQFVVDSDMPLADSIAEKLTTHNEPRATSLHRNYRKDGRVIWCEWYNSSLRDESGNILSILSLVQDVTSRVLAEERLVHQATHDGLTGLPNRALLQDRLRQAISRARRGGHRVAAMFIDLDRFKEVNDTLGHRIGDELLREMAARLGRVVRESDLLVRLSGDEFMVVLEQVTDLESPGIVAAKLLDEIRQPSRIEGHDIHVSGSVGISLFPDDAEDVESLLKNADMAMYRAKELGKNAFQLFSADLAERGVAMRLLENALRSAVVRQEFELYFQPQVHMASGRITGAEALLRWHHPSRGLVAPGEFMQLAEETGLVYEIGNWVLGAAFSQLKRWHEGGYPELMLAVNIAAGQFRSTHLEDNIRAIMAREACRPQAIEIEITETSMLADPEGVGTTLTELRQMGLRVAIDDFGTGYSSLSHLKRFPIDTLKIDKSFVADMHEKDGTAIVSAVIAMARALGINVVAEGVETDAQRHLLAAQGCDAYQGYFFSRPLPLADFNALLERNWQTTLPH